MIIIGIYFNINLNEYYIRYLSNIYPGFYLEIFLISPRLASFVGSVAIGTLSCVSVVFSFRKLSRDRNFLLFYIGVVVAGMGAVLSMQRSAWIFLAVTLVFMAIHTYRIRVLSKYHVTALVLIMLALVIIFGYIYPETYDQILERGQTFTSAVSERSIGWKNIYKNGWLLITGIGLGTGGHRALSYSNLIIADGNYHKMLFDIGIIGTGLFAIIAFLTIKTGFKNIRILAPYNVIVLGILFQAIGSNILTFQMTAPIFWYSIGCIISFEPIEKLSYRI